MISLTHPHTPYNLHVYSGAKLRPTGKKIILLWHGESGLLEEALSERDPANTHTHTHSELVPSDRLSVWQDFCSSCFASKHLVWATGRQVFRAIVQLLSSSPQQWIIYQPLRFIVLSMSETFTYSILLYCETWPITGIKGEMLAISRGSRCPAMWTSIAVQTLTSFTFSLTYCIDSMYTFLATF